MQFRDKDFKSSKATKRTESFIHQATDDRLILFQATSGFLCHRKRKLHIPALSIAPLIAMEPSLVAGNDERDPWKEPIGVLTALAITTS